MSKAIFGHKAILSACLAVALSVLFAAAIGCQGDTDGGDGAEFAAPGEMYVSDGGAGARLEMGLGGDDNIIATAQRESFWVRAYDPQGAPLPFIRIFCESERGIAILSPSSGGTAFASTSPGGHMSGEIGGLYEGSWIMECRAPEGFNLVVRMLVIVRGDIPEGFTGWEGAAGGNMGGGLIVDQPGQDVQITNIVITKVSDSQDNEVTNIDTKPDCCYPSEGAPVGEPFGYYSYTVTLSNGRDVRIFVDTVKFTVIETGATSIKEYNSQLVDANSTGSLFGPLTDFGADHDTCYKSWAGSTRVSASATGFSRGTISVRFEVKGVAGDDESFTATADIPMTVGNVNNCPSGYSAGSCGAGDCPDQ